jgi:dTDP-4-dehydrorhamnose reductase
LAAAAWDPGIEPAAAQREAVVAGRLADAVAALGSRLTVISSDAVFAGPRMFHEETANTATTPRALQVRAMERAVEHAPALVVRTHAYGFAPATTAAGFAQRALAAIEPGRAVAADGRRHATPILASDLAELLERAFELRLHGLYHMAGAERTSPYRFASELAAAFALETPRFDVEAGGSALDAETSLSSKLARRVLGVSTPGLREGLERFSAQAHNGWRDAWHVPAAAEHWQDAAA